MPLSNAQYDEIMHEYDERQLHNRHILETRRAEVLKKLPRLKEIVFLRRSGCICFRCGSLLFLLLMGSVEAFDIFQRMYLVVIPAGQNRIGITET